MPSRIRFRGLVRLANRVRSAAGSGVPPEQWAQLRKETLSALEFVQKTLDKEHASLNEVSGPSRNAVKYLQSVDWEQKPAAPTHEACDHRPLGTIRLPGHNRWLDAMLDRMAWRREQPDVLFDEIRRTSDGLERFIHDRRIEPHQLTNPQRQMRGWVAYMSTREHLRDTIAAIDRFCGAIRRRWPPTFKPDGALLVHLRPTAVMYRLRPDGGNYRLTLPTAMVTFDQAAVHALALMINGDRARGQPVVVDAMMSPPYQTVDGEIESLGGVVEQPRGAVHDLERSFQRVNSKYFDGRLDRPTLTWSRVPSSRQFGCYDFARDRVVIASTVDQPDVPEFVIDFLMYHELLHKHHGLHWHNGRGHTHTRNFRSTERRFDRYEEALQYIESLALKLHDAANM